MLRQSTTTLVLLLLVVICCNAQDATNVDSTAATSSNTTTAPSNPDASGVSPPPPTVSAPPDTSGPQQRTVSQTVLPQDDSPDTNATTPDEVSPVTQDSSQTLVLVICISLGFFVGGGACYVTLMWQQKALRIYNERFEQLLKDQAIQKKEVESQFFGKKGGDGDDDGDDDGDEAETQSNVSEGGTVVKKRRLTVEEEHQAKLDGYGDPDTLRQNARRLNAERREKERREEEKRKKLLHVRTGDDSSGTESSDDEASAVLAAKKAKKLQQQKEEEEMLDDSHLPHLARRSTKMSGADLRRGPMMVRKSSMASNPMFFHSGSTPTSSSMSPTSQPMGFTPSMSPRGLGPPRRSSLILPPSSPNQFSQDMASDTASVSSFTMQQQSSSQPGSLSLGRSTAAPPATHHPGGGNALFNALNQSLQVHHNLSELKQTSQLRHIEGLI